MQFVLNVFFVAHREVGAVAAAAACTKARNPPPRRRTATALSREDGQGTRTPWKIAGPAREASNQQRESVRRARQPAHDQAGSEQSAADDHQQGRVETRERQRASR